MHRSITLPRLHHLSSSISVLESPQRYHHRTKPNWWLIHHWRGSLRHLLTCIAISFHVGLWPDPQKLSKNFRQMSGRHQQWRCNCAPTPSDTDTHLGRTTGAERSLRPLGRWSSWWSAFLFCTFFHFVPFAKFISSAQIEKCPII